MPKNPNADSIKIARKYLDSLVLESRLLSAGVPDTSVEILGTTFDTPVMTGALSHLKNGMGAYAKGAALANALCSIGMGDNDSFGDALKSGAKVIKVIKPYEDRKEIYSRIYYAESHGAFGVGMDIEHAPDGEGNLSSVCAGMPLLLPSADELKTMIQSTPLPFFIKGVLSVQDALKAKRLGAAGIILSHHNSIMSWAIPSFALLKDIRKAVGEDFIVIADGGIEDGFDAFKALALGADLVSIARPLMGPYNETGAEGVRDTLLQFTKELKAAMVRTGTKDLKTIDPTVIHEAWWL